MFVSAEKEEQRAIVQKSSLMEVWDASPPTLWASPSHMSHNTIVPYCGNRQTGPIWGIITHQSQESNASTSEGSNVEVIGHLVLIGDKKAALVVMTYIFISCQANCRTWLQSFYYSRVLTSLVLQTLERVIPQAFPGTAFHGRRPVKNNIHLFIWSFKHKILSKDNVGIFVFQYD